jgi:hypothetical protein
MPRNILRERQRERTLLRAGVGRPPARPRRARRRRPKPKTNIRRRKATKCLSSRIEMDRKRERGGAQKSCLPFRCIYWAFAESWASRSRAEFGNGTPPGKRHREDYAGFPTLGKKFGAGLLQTVRGAGRLLMCDAWTDEASDAVLFALGPGSCAQEHSSARRHAPAARSSPASA